MENETSDSMLYSGLLSLFKCACVCGTLWVRSFLNVKYYKFFDPHNRRRRAHSRLVLYIDIDFVMYYAIAIILPEHIAQLYTILIGKILRANCI